MISKKGFSKYITFGFREEWFVGLLSKGERYFEENSLGPKQLVSFITYLKDCELLTKVKKNKTLSSKNKLRLTKLFYKLKDIFKSEGIKSKTIWGVIWINLCFNSSLFKWWANQEKGIYPRKKLIMLMSHHLEKMNRSVIDAYVSLLNTLEKSPIGEGLKQGIVERKGRERIVVKETCSKIPPILILYNLYKLSENYDLYEINLNKIENYPKSPQKIFSLSSLKVEDLLDSFMTSNLFDISINNNSYILNPNISSLEILDNYRGGLNG